MHIYHFLTRLGIIEISAENIYDAIELYRLVLPDLDYSCIKQLPASTKNLISLEKVQQN